MTTAFIALLGVIFLGLGLLKLIGIQPMRQAFAALNLGSRSRLAIGAAESLFGLALTASAAIAPLTFFAAIPLFLISAGAAAFHLLKPPRSHALPALVLAAGLLGAVILNPLGLRIVMLPHADDLPRNLYKAEELARLAPGSFIESVTPAPDGSIWITATMGADMATFDLSNATARVLSHGGSGNPTPLFDLPPRNVAGVGAFGPDGTFYLTVTGSDGGIWRFGPNDQQASLFVKAPEGVVWNGLKFGPDGLLYAAGSNDGAIWRIVPDSAEAIRVLADPVLQARPFVALAPGVNGLEFRGRDLIVTVSDSAKLWSAQLKEDGSFGPLTLIAQGIPGDDFAIAPDGRIFIATHPYNTVVEVDTGGTRTIIADQDTMATGSTDIALSADGTSLYVVTDGGLLGGNANAEAKLVRLMKP